jgi:hypothetical protein
VLLRGVGPAVEAGKPIPNRLAVLEQQPLTKGKPDRGRSRQLTGPSRSTRRKLLQIRVLRVTCGKTGKPEIVRFHPVSLTVGVDGATTAVKSTDRSCSEAIPLAGTAAHSRSGMPERHSATRPNGQEIEPLGPKFGPNGSVFGPIRAKFGTLGTRFRPGRRENGPEARRPFNSGGP